VVDLLTDALAVCVAGLCWFNREDEGTLKFISVVVAGVEPETDAFFVGDFVNDQSLLWYVSI
jgi:hypothetical protein